MSIIYILTPQSSASIYRQCLHWQILLKKILKVGEVKDTPHWGQLMEGGHGKQDKKKELFIYKPSSNFE